MIFSPTNVHLIASGRKTQTRRPIKRDQPCRYVTGKSYAVQPGRGRPASLRIAVIEVRHQLVGAIDFDDARAEGFRTTDEFKVAWVGLHDRDWLVETVSLLGEMTTGMPWPDLIADDLLERVGVSESGLLRRLRWLENYEIVECIDEVWWRCEGAEIAAALARFDARHAHKPVWVITFGLSREDTPRLLADRPGPDYVSSSARALHETPTHLVGEAVSESEQKWITAQAGATFGQWRALEAAHTERDAQARSIDERVQAAIRKAQAMGVDVSREVWMVRKAAPEKAERWLVALERKAFALGRAA